MNYSLHFAPLLSPFWLVSLGCIAAAALGAGLYLRRQGMGLRALACLFFALGLLNPFMLRQMREPLKAIVVLIVDRSQSQNFGARKQDTEKALNALQRKLAAYPQFETRIIEAAKQNSGNEDDPANRETHLFAPLNEALADVPPSRLGGVIMLTDGQIADIPALPAANGAASPAAPALTAALGFNAPVNALISGSPREYDRRLALIKAPRFGIAGKAVSLSFMLRDEGEMPADARQGAQVSLFVNGEKREDYRLQAGKAETIEIILPHAGANIIELSAPPLQGELTAMNNRLAVPIEGVRENLKVLLVSGEPHNGLRTWRDLLKSDAGVDLVHFTILRPPEKQDNTPISELSLIVFPTTELFVTKLKDFDLVIFDRYQHYNVLPLVYYEYMARYVENGGALLMAAGPEFAGGASPALTPLSRILPARPTGNIFEKPFLPQLTAAGRRHPVTANLEGGQAEPPKWGQWLRQIEAETDEGSTVLMQGANNAPLMILAEKGKGRIGMLMSDEGWLWARGFQGGGPYAQLYRRMAHWLMKEPELEAESLTASAKGHNITVERRTMRDNESGNPAADKASGGAGIERSGKKDGEAAKNAADKQNPIGSFHIILPSGKAMDIAPQKLAEGRYSARFVSPETGLLRVESGDKSALVHAGAPDMPEFEDIISTQAKLAPIAAATGGAVLRMREAGIGTGAAADGDKAHIGGLKIIGPAQKRLFGSGQNTDLVLQTSADSRLISESRLPLFASFWALALGLALLALTWRREAE